MPAAEMFPGPRTLRKMEVSFEDLTLDLVPGVRIRLDLTFTDGVQATILCADYQEDDLPFVVETLGDLAEAFIFGEGARDVVAWAQKRDRALQSRRVRQGL